ACPRGVGLRLRRARARREDTRVMVDVRRDYGADERRDDFRSDAVDARQMTRTFDTIRAGAGFLLWSGCVIALDALLSIACMLPTLGLPAAREQTVTAMLVVVWTLFIAAHMAAIYASIRRHRAMRDFLTHVGVYLSVAGLGATIFLCAPALALPACQ